MSFAKPMVATPVGRPNVSAPLSIRVALGRTLAELYILFGMIKSSIRIAAQKHINPSNLIIESKAFDFTSSQDHKIIKSEELTKS